MMAATTAWRVLGSSVTGSGHRKTGRGCDDAHCYRTLNDGILLIAVADGAGSAPHSAEGAACAVEAAVNTAEHLLLQGEPQSIDSWRALLTSVLKTARLEIEALTAREYDESQRDSEDSDHSYGDLRDFATTLLLAIITPVTVATVQVGDGAVVMQHSDGSVGTVTTPDHGEYINESTFITSSQYLSRAQYIVQPCDNATGIAMFSDGLQMLALNLATNQAHSPFFEPLFIFARASDATEAELTAFLDSERVCTQTDDDKTLVLAVRV